MGSRFLLDRLLLFLLFLLFDFDNVVRLRLHGVADQLHVFIDKDWHALEDGLRGYVDHVGWPTMVQMRQHLGMLHVAVSSLEVVL